MTETPGNAMLLAIGEYFLLLTWKFQDEILRLQARYLEAGGRFTVPIPERKIVNGQYRSAEALGLG